MHARKHFLIFKKVYRFFCNAIFSILTRRRLFGSHKIASLPRFSRGKTIIFQKRNRFYIGYNCHVGTNIFLDGDGILIASNVSFVGGDHDITDISVKIYDAGRAEQIGVIIHEDVWIGHGAIVLDGVTLHRGSVVAAGAVVTRDTDRYGIYAGVPAKKVGQRS